MSSVVILDGLSFCIYTKSRANSANRCGVIAKKCIFQHDGRLPYQILKFWVLVIFQS